MWWSGLVETHGRRGYSQPAGRPGDNPAGRRQEYRGIVLEEMDLEAIIERKPHIVLIDELAHTNAPGSRKPQTLPGCPGYPCPGDPCHHDPEHPAPGEPLRYR
ncbi:MAG: hypothetical protein MZV70_57335 [Desulfobacterales bacterium]|nr:hypothetical protein [Desulfobacterales bacterium]